MRALLGGAPVRYADIQLPATTGAGASPFAEALGLRDRPTVEGVLEALAAWAAPAELATSVGAPWAASGKPAASVEALLPLYEWLQRAAERSA